MAEKVKKTTTVKAAPKKVVKEKEVKEANEFAGKYIAAIGRRKTATARVRLYLEGKGGVVVNNQKPTKYFSEDQANLITQPLKLTGQNRNLSVSAVVHGGGKNGQAEAIRLGVARALLKIDENLKPALKAADYLTRDPREVERKKPGLRKARRAPQWSKR
ncbi:MAG TPA: 30S ribosomal protein S9 [bacterium]|nr:30S ribosomal protein S9 [bacterium]HPT29953.1 30S ribosomal protein S9 [bacterium]